MSTDLTSLEPNRGALAVSSGTLPAGLRAAIRRASDFARAENAANTRRAYRSDIAAFQAWCAGRGVAALPAAPEVVAAFLSAEADRGVKASTIGRRVAAIRYAHRLADLPVPTDDERVRAVVRGIRRTFGIAKRPKTPATNDRLLAMVAPLGNTPAALRDRALLLLGFAGAFRRSELVALDLADIEETVEGLRVTIRRQDQPGRCRRYGRDRARIGGVPSRGVEGVARRGWDHTGSDFPTGEQGR